MQWPHAHHCAALVAVCQEIEYQFLLINGSGVLYINLLCAEVKFSVSRVVGIKIHFLLKLDVHDGCKLTLLLV